ncbi:MAG: hypothetical protein FIA97_02975 [Methylococcaceae bacterium]|nr:hypothetical protein [Methylococcaceae bacterium]
MNDARIKHLLCTASLLLASAYSGGAAAHTWSGIINNNKDAGSTEAWTINCYDPATYYLYFSVEFLYRYPSGPGKLMATITKGNMGQSTRDGIVNDGSPSATIAMPGRSGSYFVTVHHTTPGIASYVIQAFCVSGGGSELSNPPVTWTQVINN